ncbi:hypothetical protein M3M39_05795 [Fructilactobacillus hinvesii]|uniref:Uncharacterized protein n=1 Tax=Fructilactobacillus hinvesii TaxID=2940300 RepID=A0ABY5BT47_9LACO|nr:hypothetical protein [Fructilactobacillus hinvesii]USS87633.1 hypothetical protein M3M39_05795 [Fructilactobacillus hinvesii]
MNNFWMVLASSSGPILTAINVAWSIHLGHKNNVDKQNKEERSQAEKVSAWISINEIFIRNDSNLPIYDVKTYLKNPKNNRNPYVIMYDKKPANFDVFPPGQQCGRLFNKESIINKPVRIDFKDTRGLKWTRNFDGLLKKQDKLEI